MPSIFKSDIAGKDKDNPDDQNEELYKRIFSKAGRDFVAIEDFKDAMGLMMFIVDPLGLNPFEYSDHHAKEIAERYQRLLDKGKSGGEEKRDLIQPKKSKKDKS